MMTIMTLNNKPNTIPPSLIQEADNMSKETGMSFRLCLEILYLSPKGAGQEGVKGPSEKGDADGD